MGKVSFVFGALPKKKQSKKEEKKCLQIIFKIDFSHNKVSPKNPFFPQNHFFGENN